MEEEGGCREGRAYHVQQKAQQEAQAPAEARRRRAPGGKLCRRRAGRSRTFMLRQYHLLQGARQAGGGEARRRAGSDERTQAGSRCGGGNGGCG
jgi:hypothetical protein